MRRLIKKSELISGFYNGFNEYCELYKNPTSNEIEEIKEQDGYDSVRGCIYNNGDIYIWPSTIQHYEFNKYCKDYNVDVKNNFIFFWDGSSNQWAIDAHNQYSVDEIKQFIVKNKNILSNIGDIQAEFFISRAIDKRSIILQYNDIF